MPAVLAHYQRVHWKFFQLLALYLQNQYWSRASETSKQQKSFPNMNYLNLSQVKRIIAPIFPKQQLNVLNFISVHSWTSTLDTLYKSLLLLFICNSSCHTSSKCCTWIWHSSNPVAVGLCSTYSSCINTQQGNTETCISYWIQDVIGTKSSTEMLESQHSNKFYCSIYVSVKSKHNILFINTKLISAIQPNT